MILCCAEALIDIIPSTNQSGGQLGKALAGSNVGSEFAIVSDRPPTLEFVQLAGGHATYTFYDENTAGLGLDPAQLPDIPDTVSAMYFGGIRLINEPCADFYMQLAVRESAKKVIVIDPNIRADFISDEALIENG